jgi:thiamine pyrophosphokinase
MTHAIILIGGTPAIAAPAPKSGGETIVIAADSGLHHATALGLTPDLVIGDFDSVDPQLLAAARDRGAQLEPHPRDKDATDFELALAAAQARGARSVSVYGGTDGRFDHVLANVAVLAAPEYVDLEIRAYLGSAIITVVHTQAPLSGQVDDLVSLLAVGAPASGVQTSGLRWPLCGETLHPGSARGVSNAFIEPTALVTVERGTLIAIQPGDPH